MKLSDFDVVPVVVAALAVGILGTAVILTTLDNAPYSDKDRKLSFIQRCIEGGNILMMNDVEIVCKFTRGEK